MNRNISEEECILAEFNSVLYGLSLVESALDHKMVVDSTRAGAVDELTGVVFGEWWNGQPC